MKKRSTMILLFFILFQTFTACNQKNDLNKSNSQMSSDLVKKQNDISNNNSFVLSSSEISEDGKLPKDFTGDGSAATLPLQWRGVPEGTKSFALIMHHVAPDMTKWYWILYNIPADRRKLDKNTHGVGILGNNSVNGRCEYAPPHSKGPGKKRYIYTLYALSAPVKLEVEQAKVNRAVLLDAMKDKIIFSTTLNVNYSRNVSGKPAPERKHLKGQKGSSQR